MPISKCSPPENNDNQDELSNNAIEIILGSGKGHKEDLPFRVKGLYMSNGIDFKARMYVGKNIWDPYACLFKLLKHYDNNKGLLCVQESFPCIDVK